MILSYYDLRNGVKGSEMMYVDFIVGDFVVIEI